LAAFGRTCERLADNAAGTCVGDSADEPQNGTPTAQDDVSSD
jgi:hypothetical protein